jgi:hypothetical protein
MRDLLDSVELSDLVEGVDGRRETTMEAEDLSLNDGCQWQIIE